MKQRHALAPSLSTRRLTGEAHDWCRFGGAHKLLPEGNCVFLAGLSKLRSAASFDVRDRISVTLHLLSGASRKIFLIKGEPKLETWFRMEASPEQVCSPPHSLLPGRRNARRSTVPRRGSPCQASFGLL